MQMATDPETSSVRDPLLNQQRPQQPQYVVALPPYPPPHQKLLLRKSCRRCLLFLAVFLIYLVAAAYLLWPSDPSLSIVGLRLHRVRFHADPVYSLDATIDLTVRVRNRDFYSIDHDSLLVAIGYRGKRLGFVTTEGGGHMERRRSTFVNTTLELDRVEILGDAVWLVEDLANGVVTLDVESEITGKLGVFVFDLPLKAKIQCGVMVDVQNEKIYRQSCYSEASEEESG